MTDQKPVCLGFFFFYSFFSYTKHSQRHSPYYLNQNYYQLLSSRLLPVVSLCFFSPVSNQAADGSPEYSGI